MRITLTFLVVALGFAFCALGFEAAHAAATLQKSPNHSLGLLSYYSFDGDDTTGGTIFDRAGGYHGSASGIATSTFYTKGKVGQALNFDGINDYINAGDIATIDTATALSGCAWVKHDTLTTDDVIMSKMDGTNDGFMLFRENTGDVSLRTDEYTIHIRDSADTNVTVLEGATDSSVVNTWTHVCFTYQASSATGLRLYVNGVEDANSPGNVATIAAIDAGTNPFTIGVRSDTTTHPFDGQIDDVRVYNRVLSATEVSSLYRSGAAQFQSSSPTFLSQGLVGYWDFNGKSVRDGAILDISGNNNIGYPSGISTSTFYTRGKLGQGLDFDGSNDYIDIGDIFYSDVFSVCAWIKADVLGGTKSFVVKRNSSGVTSGTAEWYLHSAAGSSDFSFISFDSGGATALSLDSANVVTGRWYHVCAVQNGNGNTAYMYLDGAETHNAVQTAVMVDSTSRIQIGARTFNTDTRYFDGQMDDVRIYDRALSATEVASLYRSGAAQFQSSSPTFLSQGLVGYWDFNGKSVRDGAILDVSGNNNKGYPTNISTSTFYTRGKLGQALNFDGTDDYVDAGDPANIQFDIDDPFSVAFWMKEPAGIPTNDSIVTKTTNIHGVGWYFWTWTSDQLTRFNMSTDGVTVRGVITSSIIADNTWHHVVGTYQGNSNQNGMKLYVDGALVSTGASAVISGSILNSSPIRIGGGISGQYLAGKTDDVRVYNRELSAADILQLFSQGR